MSTEIILGEESFERGRIRINPENPELEWTRQSLGLARRFAQTLGFPTDEAYIKTLPEEFGPKPKSFKDLYIPAVPIIVETRFALPEILDMAGISSFFDLQRLEDWLAEGCFETPKAPYATWITYIPNTSVIEVCADLLKHDDRRGGIPFDGIALCLRDPYILNEYSLKFPGSRVRHEDAPFLSASPNPERTLPPSHPSLSYGSIELKFPKFACLVASKV